MQLEKIVLLKLNDTRNLATLPKEMQSEKIRPLQSEFKEGTRDLIRGFDPVVERIVLPNLIGLQANEPNFASRARDFWADFTVSPTKEGIRLNIATEEKVSGKRKNSEGVEEDEYIDFPVNPNDYMVYQIAMQSSKVAKTAEELANLSLYDFYIVDLDSEQRKEAAQFEEVDRADSIYIKLTSASSIEENVDKINAVLELLRDKGEALDVETLPILQKKMLLRKIKEEAPKRFISTVEDPSLATKAFIIKLYTYGVISKEGNDYFDGEINIGAGKVAVSWFQKSENSQKVLTLQARLKAAIQTKRTI